MIKSSSAAAIGILVLMSAGCSANAQPAQKIQKKLIEAGWDQPTTKRLLQNLEEMEKAPYDGVFVRAIGWDDKGHKINMREMFSNKPWKKSWFHSAISNLQAIHSKSKTLTDNFLLIGAKPGNVDWFDDAGWKQIVGHWCIAAEIAKDGHLKGLHFNPESRTKPYHQMNYNVQPQHTKHSFEEYQVKARQRGREVMTAVARVDPNLIIFPFFMNSVQAISIQSSNPQLTLQGSSYGLYPAFINGWLDAAPPSMIFVDGCEVQGYHANSKLDFLETANLVRNSALALVAPENRQKYRAQVQVSFGIYLDAYTNPSTSGWYIDPKGDTPTQRLQINVQSALNTANEYVWTWGEKYRWWPTPNTGVNSESWEDKLPGINDALFGLTHPNLLLKRKYDNLDIRDITKQWHFLADAVEAQDVASPNFDDSSWKIIDGGKWWQKQGFPKYHGVAWYRKTVTLSAFSTNQKGFLVFDGVDGTCEVFVNGRKVGEHVVGKNFTGWNKPFEIDASSALHAGKNVIAVQVTSKSQDTASGINQPVRLLTGTPR